MKRIILFSQPTEKNIKQILDLTFPKEIKHKVLAYMPSDGVNCPQKYIDEWKTYAENYQAEFRLINNSKTNAVDEQEKLLGANILVITGGNTFTLLRNLHQSGLFKTVQEFIKKEEYDKNLVGLKDFTGLKIIDFEVFSHYSEDQKEILTQYKQTIKNEIKTITNDEFLVINR